MAQKGTFAQQLANAPLVRAEQTAPETVDALPTLKGELETAIVEQMLNKQAATIAPVVLPFTLAGFKLNGKAKDYPSDDDASIITRKVAFAILALNNSGFTLSASVYRTTHTNVKDDKGRTRVATRVTMPNTGKMGGFKAVIDTDDAREQRALDEFRSHLATEFKAWLAATNGAATVTAKGNAPVGEVVDFE